MTETCCPSCLVEAGNPHVSGCDLERCSVCGGQHYSCGCPTHNPERVKWTGEEPGLAECREYGFWCRVEKGVGYVLCDANHPDAIPDLNRLMTECAWNPELARWRRQAEVI